MSEMAIFCQLRSLAPYNPGWVTSAGPMQALNLDPKQPPVVKRPASEFPEAADVYVCDKCGRDMTRHLYRGRAHVRQPLGPVRYFCCCGQDYLSGATEWDYLMCERCLFCRRAPQRHSVHFVVRSSSIRGRIPEVIYHYVCPSLPNRSLVVTNTCLSQGVVPS
jgi:hypothetical protein